MIALESYWWLPALTLGLTSSLHCAGMCGPLILAVPAPAGSIWVQQFWYHAGRIGMYVGLGTVAALFGQGMQLVGIQAFMSVFAGVLLILAALSYTRLENWAFTHVKVYKNLRVLLSNKITALWRFQTPSAWLRIGLFNGLLPCGMVYLAMAGALTQPTAPQSLGFMAFFGLGTLPLLIALRLLGNQLTLSFRQRLRKVYPVLLFSLALLFLYRGTRTLIPGLYVNEVDRTATPVCH